MLDCIGILLCFFPGVRYFTCTVALFCAKPGQAGFVHVGFADAHSSNGTRADSCWDTQMGYGTLLRLDWPKLTQLPLKGSMLQKLPNLNMKPWPLIPLMFQIPCCVSGHPHH